MEDAVAALRCFGEVFILVRPVGARILYVGSDALAEVNLYSEVCTTQVAKIS